MKILKKETGKISLHLNASILRKISSEFDGWYSKSYEQVERWIT